VVSIVTTTGYATVDFDAWPDAARALLVLLMFIGGSAGSAAGGVKVARWLIIGKHAAREVRRALHPRAVLPIRVGDRVVSEEVLRAVAAFITLYTLLIALSTLLLTALGEDLLTAFVAAAATVGNVGPGLGGVGPMASYAEIHPVGAGDADLQHVRRPPRDRDGVRARHDRLVALPRRLTREDRLAGGRGDAAAARDG
jgi:trk system potassium uptake protein